MITMISDHMSTCSLIGMNTNTQRMVVQMNMLCMSIWSWMDHCLRTASSTVRQRKSL